MACSMNWPRLLVQTSNSAYNATLIAGILQTARYDKTSLWTDRLYILVLANARRRYQRSVSWILPRPMSKICFLRSESFKRVEGRAIVHSILFQMQASEVRLAYFGCNLLPFSLIMPRRRPSQPWLEDGAVELAVVLLSILLCASTILHQPSCTTKGTS